MCPGKKYELSKRELYLLMVEIHVACNFFTKNTTAIAKAKQLKKMTDDVNNPIHTSLIVRSQNASIVLNSTSRYVACLIDQNIVKLFLMNNYIAYLERTSMGIKLRVLLRTPTP